MRVPRVATSGHPSSLIKNIEEREEKLELISGNNPCFIAFFFFRSTNTFIVSTILTRHPSLRPPDCSFINLLPFVSYRAFYHGPPCQRWFLPNGKQSNPEFRIIT